MKLAKVLWRRRFARLSANAPTREEWEAFACALPRAADQSRALGLSMADLARSFERTRDAIRAECWPSTPPE